MIPVLLTVIALISYFCGSVSTVNLTSNLYFHRNILKDYPRDNDGITRFIKDYGIKGAVVLFGTEAVKVAVPVILGGLLMGITDHSDVGRAFAMFCILLGTVFPIMYDFKGETSFVAFCVCILFVSTGTAFIMLIVFLAVYFLTHYVSLSSLAAAAAMCVGSVMMVDSDIVRRIMLFMAILIFVEYRQSIVRLARGKEEKFVYQKDISYMFDDYKEPVRNKIKRKK